jgi:MFS family permease
VTSIVEPTRSSNWAVACRVVAICALITMISQFYRNAHVVVAPDIMRDTGVTAQVLGYLSGALFVSSALMQIPAGILIDRYGPRRMIPFMLLTVIAGSLLFATAQGAASLIAARICMGIGVAAIGMAAIVASTRWFSSPYFGTVVGVILGLSYVGNLAATVPMAVVSAEIGWRASFMLVTIITAVLAGASALLIRDAPAGHSFHARSAESFAVAWRGVREVLAVRELWPLLAIAGTAYAVISCILGLWGGPYLFDIYSLDAMARGSVILCVPAGMILGNFTITPLDRILHTRKRIIVGCALATAVVLLLFAFQPRMPLIAVTIAFALIGVLSAYTTVIIAHGRCFYPDRLMGRGMTVVNTAVLAGAGIMQALTGAIAGIMAPGATSLPADVYRIIFAALALALLAALVVYRHCPDVPPSASGDGTRSEPGAVES